MDLVLAARRAHHVRTLAQRRDGGAAASARAHAGRVRALRRAGIRRSRGGLSVSPVIDSAVGWIALSFFWWGGALWTGASLVAIAPQRGMAACAMLAVVGAALLIGFGGPDDRGATRWNTDFVLFCTTGLLAAVPLLTGAALARRRLDRLRRSPLEQHHDRDRSCSSVRLPAAGCARVATADGVEGPIAA